MARVRFPRGALTADEPELSVLPDTMIVMMRDLVLPDDYGLVLEQLKAAVHRARRRAHRTVNTELLRLYWTIGHTIVKRQEQGGYGARVIERLARDLRAEFPDMTGLSPRNMAYMRSAARSWPAFDEFVQQPVATLPWGHVLVLLDKLDDRATRDWYAAQAAEHGWSRNVLLNQVKAQLHRRVGAAPSNFPAALDEDSELVQQLVKDPYNLEFLGLTGALTERHLADALMNRLQHFLVELGHGFAFVGRQYHLDVDGADFYIDLLFFHVEQLRFIRTSQTWHKRLSGSVEQVYCVGLSMASLRVRRHFRGALNGPDVVTESAGSGGVEGGGARLADPVEDRSG